MRVGSLCTGYGGLDQAVCEFYGGQLVWWSDIEPGPIAVMERHAPGVPNLGDLKEVDWSTVSPIDILTAGYPCQPFSNAGKRLGTEDPRHIWPWIAQAIGVLRPRIVVLENVAGHLRRGFDVVLADLAALGYDVRWSVVRASDAEAPHRRERLYIIAEDTHRPTGRERRSPASGEAEGGWPRADAGRRGVFPSADSSGARLEGGAFQPDRDELPAPERSGRDATSNSEGVGRRQGGAEHARLVRESDAPGDSGSGIERWGVYAPAIERWERTLGRLAPEPTQLGKRGSRVLSPRFVEWMMGLSEGHVTDTPGLTRNQQLRLLGNGVVPQQALLALQTLTEVSDVDYRGVG